MLLIPARWEVSQGARALCLLACVVTQLAASADYEFLFAQEPAPNSDKEFVNTYLDFVNSRNHETFLPIATTSIVLGLVGNACILFFYGQPSCTNVYLSRDALYLRRLAVADILVCLLVIPYAIFFEAKQISPSVACKILEYVRHVLTLTAHLLLVTYSLEFNEEENYYLSKKRLDRSTLLVIVFSSVLCLPVLVIFQVGSSVGFTHPLSDNSSRVDDPSVEWQVESRDTTLPNSDQRESNKYKEFNPDFCHKNLNYDVTDEYYGLVRALDSMYIMSFGLMLFLCILLVIVKFTQFVDSHPLMGRESIFVSVIETNNPEVSVKLNILSDNMERNIQEQRRLSRMQRKSRMSQQLMAAAPQHDPDIPTTSDKVGVGDNNNADVADTAITGSQGNPDPALVHQTQTSTDTAVDPQELAVLSAPVTDDQQSHNEVMASSLKAYIIHPGDPEPDPRRHSHTSSFILELPERPVTKRRGSRRIQDDSLPLITFVSTCQCFRSPTKRLRTVRCSSYKKTLACLIVMDIAVAALTVVLYMLSNQRSVTLNLIHIKSVFSFYMMSFIHSDLRSATWGTGSCCKCCL